MRYPILLAVLALPAAANAQANCTPLEAAHKALTEEYGEKPAYAGKLLMPNGWTVLIYQNDKTFTVVYVKPDGRTACLVGAGEGLHPLAPDEPVPGLGRQATR